MARQLLPSIDPGKRAIVAGRTGSGKTVLANWLIKRSPQRWIIFNPKHTAGYDALPDVEVLDGFNAKKLERAIFNARFVLLNFKAEESEPRFMDACVGWIHNQYDNLGLCADELYTLHDSGRPLPGLTGWLTRGRERRQSFVGLTQRPVWISRFCFSESDYIGGMALQLASDRKAMMQNAGRAEFLKKLDPHQWLWYTVATDSLGLYGPVPLPNPQD